MAAVICSGWANAAWRQRAQLCSVWLLALVGASYLTAPVAAQVVGSTAGACASAGTAVLVLSNATSTADPYAICFHTFTLTVDPATCALLLSPDASAAGLQVQGRACPAADLSGGVVAGDDVGAAIRRAMQRAALAAGAIQGVTLEPGFAGISVATPGPNTNTYTLTQGSLGSVFPTSTASTAPCPAGGAPGCAPAGAGAGASCPAGRYLAGGGAVCTLCPAGHACGGGAGAAAAACDAGTYAEAVGQPACSSCPVQTYQAEAGRTACHPCPDASYAHFTASTGCLACYLGQPRVVAGRVGGEEGAWQEGAAVEAPPELPGYRVATLAGGALGAGACPDVDHPFKSCAALEGRAVAVETAPSCLVRLYVLGDAGCSQADELSYVEGAYDTPTSMRSRPGAVTTVGFQLGPGPGGGLQLAFFDGTDPALRCSDGLTLAIPDAGCPTGTALEAAPQAAAAAGSLLPDSQCVPCQPGSHCPGGAAAACPAGQFTRRLGAAACDACPAGAVSQAGADGCQECGPGLQPSLNRDRCESCPQGTHSAVPGGPCQQCPAGSFRPAGGGEATACTRCPPGSYSAPGAAACTLCTPGHATDQEGQARCSICAPGTFATGEGSHVCNDCPAGTYAAEQGSATCRPCGGGQVTAAPGGVGATACVPCATGTYKPPGATDNRCRSCPAGYETRLEGAGAAECSPCAAGFFATAPNTPFCAKCEPGTFANSTGLYCRPRPAPSGRLRTPSPLDGARPHRGLPPPAHCFLNGPEPGLPSLHT